MSNSNDNYVRDLNQIRERFVASLDEIEFIKALHPGPHAEDIEKIRASNERIISEIDELKKRRETNRQVSEPAALDAPAPDDANHQG